MGCGYAWDQQHGLLACRQAEGSDRAQVSAPLFRACQPRHLTGALSAPCQPCAVTSPPTPHPPLCQAATPQPVTVSLCPRQMCPWPFAFQTAPRVAGQRGQKLFGQHRPTLAGEAADVEVVALDTHHLALAGVPTAVALDDGGAAPRGVGVLLIGNC